MSKYRGIVAALLIVLVIPAWTAGAAMASCSEMRAVPHQCCMAREAGADPVPSPEGSVTQSMECHCGVIPPAVAEQGQPVLYQPAWAMSPGEGPCGGGLVPTISRVEVNSSPPPTSAAGAFLLHCTFLI